MRTRRLFGADRTKEHSWTTPQVVPGLTQTILPTRQGRMRVEAELTRQFEAENPGLARQIRANRGRVLVRYRPLGNGQFEATFRSPLETTRAGMGFYDRVIRADRNPRRFTLRRRTEVIEHHYDVRQTRRGTRVRPLGNAPRAPTLQASRSERAGGQEFERATVPRRIRDAVVATPGAVVRTIVQAPLRIVGGVARAAGALVGIGRQDHPKRLTRTRVRVPRIEGRRMRPTELFPQVPFERVVDDRGRPTGEWEATPQVEGLRQIIKRRWGRVVIETQVTRAFKRQFPDVIRQLRRNRNAILTAIEGDAQQRVFVLQHALAPRGRDRYRFRSKTIRSEARRFRRYLTAEDSRSTDLTAEQVLSMGLPDTVRDANEPSEVHAQNNVATENEEVPPAFSDAELLSEDEQRAANPSEIPRPMQEYAVAQRSERDRRAARVRAAEAQQPWWAGASARRSQRHSPARQSGTNRLRADARAADSDDVAESPNQEDTPVADNDNRAP